LTTFVIRRLVQIILVLMVVSVIIFSMAHLAPGDPALIMMGGKQSSPEVLENVRNKYHLNDPLVTQYAYWMTGVLKGDLGESYKMKQSVTDMIIDRLPLTIQLAAMSMFFTLLLAVPLGILAAVKKSTIVDHVATSLALVCLSSPVFLTGIILILVFSYKLQWLPAFGIGNNVVENFKFMLLPSIALSLNMIALNMKMTRGSMIEIMDTQYIKTARSKGMPQNMVILKHGLKNAIIPILTVSSLQIGFLMVGTVLVEVTFGIGGLGSLIINAVKSSDYPVVQGTVLFMVTVFLLINLMVDILYAVIDPRIKY